MVVSSARSLHVPYQAQDNPFYEKLFLGWWLNLFVNFMSSSFASLPLSEQSRCAILNLLDPKLCYETLNPQHPPEH